MSKSTRGRIAIPPSGKLAWSLKFSSHNSDTAIAELVDNAFDTGVAASKVFIYKSDNEIVIVDNGSGMSYEILEDALKPGSSETKLGEKRLGIFGVGLNLGASHLGNRFTVMTRKVGDTPYVGIYDIDLMSREGFVAETGTMNTTEAGIYTHYLSEIKAIAGTVIIIDKLEEEYRGDNVTFCSSLTRFLGEAFRYKLGAKRSITIFAKERNTEKVIEVQPLFPLQTQVKMTPNKKLPPPPPSKLLPPISKTFTDPKTKRRFDVRIQFSYLPSFPPGTDFDLQFHVAESNQGIYYLRNERQIMRARPWINRGKHNQLNRLRCEISFDANGDNAFGTNSEKNRVLHPAWFRRELEEVMKPIILRYQDEARAEALTTRENDPEFMKSLKRIGMMISKDFERKRVTRAPRTHFGARRPVAGGKTEKRPASHNPYIQPSQPTGLHIEFVPAENLGNRIYEIDDNVTTSLVIRLNRNHSFYRVIHDNEAIMPDMLKMIAAQAWGEREVTLEMMSLSGPHLPNEILDLYAERIGSQVHKLLAEI